MILNTISLLYKARPKRKSHVNIKEGLIGQGLPLCKEEEGQCMDMRILLHNKARIVKLTQ